MIKEQPIEKSLRNSFPQIEVHIFHPDPQVCIDIGVALRIEGFQVSTSRRRDEFEAMVRARMPRIVIVAAQLDGTGGPEMVYGAMQPGQIVRVLAAAAPRDLVTAVEAMRHGAFDVISLPLDTELMFRQVRRAVEDLVDLTSPLKVKLRADLTPRERQVLNLIVDGASNKEAAVALKISPRTVEVHRARVMTKMGAANTAALVRKVLEHRT